MTNTDVHLTQLITKNVKQASMCTSCAVMASRVTPPVEGEAKVDGVEEARGVAILVRGRFSQSWASFH